MLSPGKLQITRIYISVPFSSVRRLPTVKLDGGKFEKLGVRVEEFSRFSPFVSLILGKVVKDAADFPAAFSRWSDERRIVGDKRKSRLRVSVRR